VLIGIIFKKGDMVTKKNRKEKKTTFVLFRDQILNPNKEIAIRAKTMFFI
jgi:hypothetical protein